MFKNFIKCITGKNKKDLEKKMPKMNENMKMSGSVKMTGRDATGKVVFIKKFINLITNAGFDFRCNVIGLAAQPNEMAWMAVGTGVAGDATATTLTTETFRVAATYAHTTGTKTFTLTGNFTNPAAITEYGCLNAATAGILLNIAGFGAITIDSLEIEMTGTLT